MLDANRAVRPAFDPKADHAIGCIEVGAPIKLDNNAAGISLDPDQADYRDAKADGEA